MASTTTNDDTDAPRCPITGIARIRTGETLDMNNNNNGNNNNNMDGTTTPTKNGEKTNGVVETPVLPGRGGKPVYYHSYLQLDKVLNAQQTMSGLAGVGDGKGAHDEHLFIVIHQVYELWFKQILHELNDVVKIFSQPEVRDPQMGTVIHRLRRCTEIQRVLVDQLTVLETMTPLDFLDFRDYLFPASGFQSMQFRKIENILGLNPNTRMRYSGKHYCAYLKEDHADTIKELEKQKSLFDLVEKWLERTPFLVVDEYDFWANYSKAIKVMLNRDREVIEKQAKELGLSDEQKNEQLASIDVTAKHYQSLLNEEEYEKLRKRGDRRLSFGAMKAALLITLYQDEPMLHLPFQVLQLLMDIDEYFTNWRYRHALMVHRMIGIKLGTGGSSGYAYLRATAQRHKIFGDLFNLSTFIIPRSFLPPLPQNLKRRLSFAGTLTG
jgi:tryptophan 2,3-dioxygenase